jgi:hypothetical protein
MTGCAAVGSLAMMLVEPRAAVGDADPTFDGSSEIYPFLYETMAAERPVRASNLITGSGSHYASRMVKGSYVPKGAIGLQLGPAEYDLWLPRIFGAAESANVFALNNSLPLFDMMIYRDNGVFYYRNCVVAAALFHSRSADGGDEEEILNLQLRIIARQEDLTKSWPGTVPTLTDGEDYSPYVFPQGLFSINGSAHDFMEAQILVDNGIVAKNRNSYTPNCVYKTRRRVRAEVTTPFTAAAWTAAQALYDAADDVRIRWETGSGGADEAIQFDFPKARNMQKPPVTRGHSEMPLEFVLEAGATAANNEMSVTNIS